MLVISNEEMALSKEAVSVKVMEFMVKTMAVFLRKSRKKLGNFRHFVAADKVALQRVAVPTREHELLAVIGQDLLGQFRHIIPTIGNVDGQILASIASRINDSDFVLGDGGRVHG